MKVKRIALLLVVLALVITLEVVLMHSCTSDDAAAGPTPTPALTDEPTVNTPAPISTAIPEAPGFTSPPGAAPNTAPTRPPATNAPAAATQPPAAQAPTDPPAPPAAATNVPPDVVGGTISGGSFASNTGTGLNMSVSWSAQNQGGGTARITVTGTVNSYALNVSSLPISITYGSYSTSVMGKSIKVDGTSLASSTLFTATLDVPADTADTMTVSWHYNGTYSEVALDDITASGYVYT